MTVAAVAQIAGLLTGAAVMLGLGQSLPTGSLLWYSIAAGVAGAIGLLALYRALAIGIMSIAAPISALAAVVPFVWGLAEGERPGSVQLVGAALALGGALLAAREPSHAHVSRERFKQSVGLAAISAVLLGICLVLLGKAAPAGAMPVIVADRIATSAVIVPIALGLRKLPAFTAAGLLPPFAVGLFDTGANVLYIAAFEAGGPLAMIGVLASLYPVTTVVCARAFLGETMERHQAAGVLIALLGVAVVAAG